MMLNNKNSISGLDHLPKPVVNLIGVDGNAFSILGMVCRELRRSGWNRDQVDCFYAEATSGDYNHLLGVCAKYTVHGGVDEDCDDED
jgi:hypothetical protein